MVPLLPGFERRNGADHAFLADLHAAADAGILQVGSAHEFGAAGHDAAGRPAQELVGRIEGEIRLYGEEALQVVFGRGVDHHRHAPRMADLHELVEGNEPVLHRVVRDHVECRRRALRDGAAELILARGGGLADRHDARAGKPDALLYRGAIAHHMPRLDEHFVLQARRIR